MENINLFFKNLKISTSNSVFLVAASGGPDSVALLDMLVKIVDCPKKQIKVAHLDHCLRIDSFQESQVLKSYCNHKEIELIEKEWSIELHPKNGIEAAARNYRYSFFKSICKEEKIDFLLTAHHGDDLIENILLKFIRSGDVKEMNSLQESGKFSNTIILRPLLKWSKDELLEYADNNNLAYVIDNTNYEDDTLRNRLRHHVVPLLKMENKNMVKNANRFLKSERELEITEKSYFSKVKDPEIYLETLKWNYKSDLKALTFLELKQYFELMVTKYFSQKVHFNPLDFKEKKKISKDNINIIFYQDYVFLSQTKSTIKKEKIIPIMIEKQFNWNNKTFVISLNKKNDLEKVKLLDYFYTDRQADFQAGAINSGDKLILANGQEVKPKKKFAEQGIPNFLRPQCLTIRNNKKIVWVEKIFRNQNFDPNYARYFIYEILKD